MTDKQLLDKYRGCLLGGAVGDALGVPVEFLDEPDIFKEYGKRGIRNFTKLGGTGKFSDDTQMTLFTAAGLLACDVNENFTTLCEEKTQEENQNADTALSANLRNRNYIPYIADAYRDWLQTQRQHGVPYDERKHSWLRDVDALYYRCAPGRTCLYSIIDGCNGTIENPQNDSKGCGGVMRAAPIGLYLSATDLPAEEIDRIGAEAAALTHGHDLGYIPAAALVHIINLIVHKGASLREAVEDSIAAMQKLFASSPNINKFTELMQKAVQLSQSDVPTLDAIHELGEGWVAEETLAIVVYCCLRFPDSFEKAVAASVNHWGDSDSTGAVAGNIMGALLGMKKIPKKLAENIYLKETVLEVADDLFDYRENGKHNKTSMEVWKKKYGAGCA